MACRWLGSRKDSVRDYNQQKGDEPYYWRQDAAIQRARTSNTRGREVRGVRGVGAWSILWIPTTEGASTPYVEFVYGQKTTGGDGLRTCG